ncbi:hypothetical protein I601_2336 [Nocardioides dokdonensis FR1436]|uniref:Uncharacterized protein n=1 Tax=Nocardioides dokdonensis FR1436 TaxID=1300347 RepID=A0A1A9GKD5_9ACTN|nr:hypothetical protein [Nocardioides dokdonensis]ANH38759.1 hypothetical protein I601_2336 [Nocardioides dokdonensis FR1436]
MATMKLSRALSAATASYGVFALVQPDHLPDALGSARGDRDGYRLLAQAYGVRDLAISSAGMFGSPAVVRAAMRMRIAMDLGDCALLALRTEGDVRRKVMGVTLGWGALNIAALLIDRRD